MLLKYNTEYKNMNIGNIKDKIVQEIKSQCRNKELEKKNGIGYLSWWPTSSPQVYTRDFSLLFKPKIGAWKTIEIEITSHTSS